MSLLVFEGFLNEFEGGVGWASAVACGVGCAVELVDFECTGFEGFDCFGHGLFYHWGYKVRAGHWGSDRLSGGAGPLCVPRWVLLSR